MKQSLSVDIHGRHSPAPSPPPTPTFFFSPSKVRLIYISQTCSFLLRNRFSWSVGAGSLSARYHPAGTAQPSSQMGVFQPNKTYELNFISLSGLWYVESPRFISTLIPTPVYCFCSLMHEGGFRNQNLPGIYNCMFYPTLELRALFSPGLSVFLTHSHIHTLSHSLAHRFSRRISLQKAAICIEILPASRGHVARYWISLAFCAILIVCHFCLRPRLCALQIKPMETWKVEHCPHFHQEIAYQASPWLPLACVTFFIKVALVSPMLCPIWAMDSSVKSSSQANSSPFPNPTAVSPLFIFSPSFSGSRDALWCRWQSVLGPDATVNLNCAAVSVVVFIRVFWPLRVLIRM